MSTLSVTWALFALLQELLCRVNCRFVDSLSSHHCPSIRPDRLIIHSFLPDEVQWLCRLDVNKDFFVEASSPESDHSYHESFVSIVPLTRTLTCDTPQPDEAVAWSRHNTLLLSPIPDLYYGQHVSRRSDAQGFQTCAEVNLGVRYQFALALSPSPEDRYHEEKFCHSTRA